MSIKLESSDNVIFDTDRETIKCIEGIDTMLADLSGTYDDSAIKLPNVKADILKLVLEWAEHHKNDPEDGSGEQKTSDVSEWDANFLKVDQGTLFRLILASNAWRIKGLKHVACKTFAGMLKGKSPEEIRKELGIINDFTPEADA